MHPALYLLFLESPRSSFRNSSRSTDVTSPASLVMGSWAVVRPAGLEPATCRLGNDRSAAASVEGQGLLTTTTRPSADSPAVEQRGGATIRDVVRRELADNDIDVVVRAWPHAPREIQLAILALVRTITSPSGLT